MKSRPSRALIATGYWLAFLLIVLPVLQPVVTLLPFQPGSIRWRLEAFGALSQILVLPLSGGALAVGIATLLGHRKAVRALSAVAFVAASGLAATIVVFALDFVQYRRAVDPELLGFYRAAGLVYAAAFVLGCAFLTWLGVAAWRASKLSKRRRMKVTGGASGRAPDPVGDGR